MRERERERGEERVRGGGGTRERRRGRRVGVAALWQTWRQEAWEQASQRSGWRSKAEERARAGEPGRSGGPGTGGSEDQRLPGLVPRWQGPRRSPASAPLPRLTIRGVWPEGDLDLKLPVGVLDGGQRQEGVGGLREVGHHTLCGQKAQFQTTLPGAGAGCGRSPGRGGGVCGLTWHLQLGEGLDLALAVGGGADVRARILGLDRGQQQHVVL